MPTMERRCSRAGIHLEEVGEADVAAEVAGDAEGDGDWELDVDGDLIVEVDREAGQTHGRIS